MAKREPLNIQRDNGEDSPDEQTEGMLEFLADASGVDQTLDLDAEAGGEVEEVPVVTSDENAPQVTVAANAENAPDDTNQEDKDFESATQTATATTAEQPQTPPPAETTGETSVQPQAQTHPVHERVPPVEAPVTQEEPISQEQISQIYGEWRRTTEDLLATQHYALSEELIQELEVDPAKAIPRIAAKVYLDAVTAVTSQITLHLPRMVRTVLQQSTSFQKSEDKFFDRWKELAKHPQGKNTVIKIGQVYRQLNPAASEEDFINEVGAQSMVALRLNPSFVPVTPQVNGNGQQQPFVPTAQTPAGGGIPRNRAPQNPWDALNSEFDAIEEEIDSR